jgi:hypothetical protein
MKPVTLNLASRPFRNNVIAGTVLGVVGAVIVIMTVANLWVYLGYGQSYAQLQLDQARDRAKISQMEAEEKRLAGEVRARDFRRVFERGKLASELIRKSAFSWTLLFNTLETVVPPDIVMTAIRPNISAEGIVIRIEGVAKQHLALLTFEERLLRHPAFSKVFPSNERQLNPSLPDITFLLTCDYLPEHAGTADTVAKGPDTPGAGASGGEAAPDGAAPVTADAGAAAQPGAAPSAAPGATPAPVAAMVGRDGRPRDARGPGRTVIAPGAIFVAAATASTGRPATIKPPAAASAAQPVESAPAGGASPATGPSPAAAPIQTASTGKNPAVAAPKSAPGPAPAPATPRPASTSAVAPASTGAPPAGATSAGAATATSAAQTAPPAPPPAGPKVDPNDPRLAGAHGPRRRLSVGPAPAQRLDIPLNFTDRMVAEIYDRMGRAYSVRFDLDPIVDRKARVTINLQGRKLDDAVVLMGGMAHHRISRISDGVYRVSPAEQGMPLGDAPVAEEPLHPGGRR